MVWRDWRPGGGIYGARVSNGAVLDPDGIPITTGYAVAPSVAFDGTNYLVVWVGLDINDRQIIHGKRISQNGTLLDESPIQVSTEQAGAPSVAFDGANYVVAWENYRLKTPSDIYGARVSPDGTVLDGEAVPIATSPTHETAPAATAGSEGRVAISYERVAPEYGGTNRAFLRFFDDGVPPPPPPPPRLHHLHLRSHLRHHRPRHHRHLRHRRRPHRHLHLHLLRPVRCAAGDRLEASPGPHADPRETLLRRAHPPCSLQAGGPRDRPEPEAGQEARTRQQGEPGARPQIDKGASGPEVRQGGIKVAARPAEIGRDTVDDQNDE